MDPATRPSSITEDTINHLKWLIEIAEHKILQFPGLKRVSLSEVHQDMGEETISSRWYPL